VSVEREWMGLTHDTIALVGLVGFAWRLRIGWRWAWKAYVAAEVVGLPVMTIFSVYFALPHLPAEADVRWILLGFFGFGLAFSLASLYALFRYAFRDDAVWRSPTAESS
jgi:hypothetical protein